MKKACTYLLILTVFCGCSGIGNKTIKLSFIVDVDHPYENKGSYKHDILDNTLTVIKKRLEGYNISQPKVQLSKNDAKITVEVTTKYSADELSGMLLQPGLLQIVEAYSNEDFFQVLQQMNDTLAKTLQPATAKRVVVEKEPEEKFDSTSLKGYLKKSKAGKGGNFISDNPLFAILGPYVDLDNNLLPGPLVGRIMMKDTAKLRLYLCNDAVKAVLPTDVRFLFQAEKGDSILLVYAVKQPDPLSAPIGGQYIAGAKWDINEYSKKPVITVEMNEAGTRKWEWLTGKNIGHFLAIIFDGKILTCPRVQGQISGKYTEISGAFTLEQAKALAAQINSGELPAPIRLSQ